MKRTKNVLTAELCLMVALTLLVVVLYESDTLAAGALRGYNDLLFIITTVMELLTIGAIPLSLYLFRIEKVHRSLTTAADKPRQLLLWGSLRMMLVCVPMLSNTLFYYLFGFSVAFGYLAIVLFLCLFMIYPSMKRCEYEVTPSTVNDKP